ARLPRDSPRLLLRVVVLTAAAASLAALAAGASAARQSGSAERLPEVAIYVRSDERTGIYRFRADGRPTGWITRQIEPQAEASCWSADGRLVAFTTVGGRLEVLDERTGRARLMPVATGWSCQSFSPDGRFLLAGAPPAFCLRTQPHQPRSGCVDAFRRLLLIPLADGKSRPLSFGRKGGVRSPAGPPASGRLAFIRLRRFGYPPSGGRPEVLTVRRRDEPHPVGPKSLFISTVSWAPEGRTLLFERGSSGYPTARGSLFTFD